MKKVKLKYLGYKDKYYLFEDEMDSKIRFSECRSELIYEFDLRGNTNVNLLFEISYFSSFDGDVEAKIISDLQRISVI